MPQDGTAFNEKTQNLKTINHKGHEGAGRKSGDLEKPKTFETQRNGGSRGRRIGRSEDDLNHKGHEGARRQSGDLENPKSL